MKKNLHRIAVCLCCICALTVLSCRSSRQGKDGKPIRWNGVGKDTSLFHLDQLLVLYKHAPSPYHKKLIQDAILVNGIKVDSIRKCNSCDSYVELWMGKDIHTVINGDGVSGGSGRGGSKGVGDDSLAQYSLNFYNKPPLDSSPALRDSMIIPNRKIKTAVSGSGKDTVIVAVLDTGIDTANFVDGRYLWKNRSESNDGNDDDADCYVNDVNGWNFVSNTNNIQDDNHSRHGTLVSNYIIREFTHSPHNFVQIMGLKTHDASGYGDLFGSICAIHYAIKKGANIINASWGFYYYQETHPYLDSLITKVLPSKGILFITAAGNKIDAEDALARQIYQDSMHVTLSDFALRDLAIHNFYPGCLSKSGDNVLTVTTTDGTMVSPTQNHSSKYADLGVQADSVTTDRMWFREPFTLPEHYISGSSFATAITSGKVGAYLPKSMYVSGINKTQVLSTLAALGSVSPNPVLIFNGPSLLTGGLIRGGLYLKPRN